MSPTIFLLFRLFAFSSFPYYNIYFACIYFTEQKENTHRLVREVPLLIGRMRVHSLGRQGTVEQYSAHEDTLWRAQRLLTAHPLAYQQTA